MKKLRVFQHVTKRTASGFSIRNSGTVLLLFLLVPYIITSLSGNMWRKETKDISAMRKQLKEERYQVINKTSLGEETIPMELYVADLLARTMEEDFEPEALKAQAILLRTNLIPEEGEVRQVVDKEYGKKDIPACYIQATAETAGIYIEYENHPVYAAYFKVSSGSTRNAREVLGIDAYPYLQAALCNRDFLSTEYVDTITCTLREFEQKWQELEKTSYETIDSSGEKMVEQCGDDLELIRDSAGYVLGIKKGDKWVTGEAFRYKFHLPSSDFRISLKEDNIIFDTKGAGHGFGMSQFAANEMALQGEKYPDILAYFFKGTSLTRISYQ